MIVIVYALWLGGLESLKENNFERSNIYNGFYPDVAVNESFYIYLSHEEGIAGLRDEHILSGIKIFKGYGGIFLRTKHVENLEKRDFPWDDPEMFSYILSNFTVWYQSRLYRSMYSNFSISYLYEKNYIFSSSGGFFSTAIRYNLGNFFFLFYYSNGLPVKYGTEETPFPVQLWLSLNYYNMFFDTYFRIYSNAQSDFYFSYNRWLISPFVNIKFIGINEISPGFKISIKNIDIYYLVTIREEGLKHVVNLSYHNYIRSVDTVDNLVYQTAQSFYDAGIVSFKNKKYDDAIEDFDRALIWYPEFEKAKKSLQEVESLKRNVEINRHYEKGKLFYKTKNWLGVLREFSYISSFVHDDSVDVYLKEAYINLKTGKDLLPLGLKDTFDMAIEYFKKGDFVNASKLFSYIAQNNKDTIFTIYLEMSDKAREEWENINLFKAREYLSKGMYLKAKEMVTRILAKENLKEARILEEEIKRKIREETKTYMQKGLKMYANGMLTKSLFYFNKVLSLDSDNLEAKKYIERINRSKKYSKKDIESLYVQGITAYTTGDYDTAISLWKKILEIDPSNKKARLNIERAQRRKLSLDNHK